MLFRQKLRVEGRPSLGLQLWFLWGRSPKIHTLSRWRGVDCGRGPDGFSLRRVEYSKGVLGWFTPSFMSTPLPNPPPCLLQISGTTSSGLSSLTAKHHVWSEHSSAALYQSHPVFLYVSLACVILKDECQPRARHKMGPQPLFVE